MTLPMGLGWAQRLRAEALAAAREVLPDALAEDLCVAADFILTGDVPGRDGPAGDPLVDWLRKMPAQAVLDAEAGIVHAHVVDDPDESVQLPNDPLTSGRCQSRLPGTAIRCVIVAGHRGQHGQGSSQW